MTHNLQHGRGCQYQGMVCIWNILVLYIIWLFGTQTAKLLPQLWYNPGYIIYVLVFIVFSYYFTIMNLYALCTLHETNWGTRSGIGNISDATVVVNTGPQSDEKLPKSYSIQPVTQPQSPFNDDYTADLAYARPEWQHPEYEESIYVQ
ncbi:hypothetical protein EDD85DRAFT_784178 [Armillaria nabsnona]|nr:hypothetical protein EDD85DRAFT_784178 [Armillaria nabsnona]